MRGSKGTSDFEAYIQNLQQGLATASTGRQLNAYAPGIRTQQMLVHNPYAATVADRGILRCRVTPPGSR